MPLTFGIPLGLLLIIVGAVLRFAIKQRIARTAGFILLAIGLVITVGTAVLVVLAINSSM